MVELFEECRKSLGGYEAPYHRKREDFIQWANLLKRCREASKPWPLTEKKFLKALMHYMETPQSSHTIADLCSRFADFYRAAIDRFKIPVTEGERDGKTANSASDARRERFEQAADRIKAGEVI
jgi:hypothetical protein